MRRESEKDLELSLTDTRILKQILLPKNHSRPPQYGEEGNCAPRELCQWSSNKPLTLPAHSLTLA
jgi:hypothetical protein